ncbi:MAG: hypothetical protein RLZZ292_2291 [Bacteroidota bacterium]|jgi:hypothetical protein
MNRQLLFQTLYGVGFVPDKKKKELRRSRKQARRTFGYIDKQMVRLYSQDYFHHPTFKETRVKLKICLYRNSQKTISLMFGQDIVFHGIFNTDNEKALEMLLLFLLNPLFQYEFTSPVSDFSRGNALIKRGYCDSWEGFKMNGLQNSYA